MALTGTLTLTADITQTVVNNITEPTETMPTETWTVTSGTGQNQMDLLYHVAGTATTSPTDYDLAGSLTDSFGNALTFVEVRYIFIKVFGATEDTYIEVGGGDDGAGNNAFVNWVANATDKLRIYREGALLMYNPDPAGYAVTAGTGDILRLVASAGSIKYDMVIGGVSA